MVVAAPSILFVCLGNICRSPSAEGVFRHAAARAGLKPNDLIIAIDGRPIDNFTDMQRIVSSSPNVTLALTLLRAGREMTVSATPELKVINSSFGKQRLGILEAELQQPALRPPVAKAEHRVAADEGTKAAIGLAAAHGEAEPRLQHMVLAADVVAPMAIALLHAAGIEDMHAA